MVSVLLHRRSETTGPQTAPVATAQAQNTMACRPGIDPAPLIHSTPRYTPGDQRAIRACVTSNLPPPPRLLDDRLDGTPYSFPDDEDGTARAQAILADQLRIYQRMADVRAAFAEHADEIRMQVERDFDYRLIQQSNAIEGVHTSFPQTKELLDAAFESATPIAEFSFRSAVSEDPKVLEVVGHGNALSFVRQLAGSFAERRHLSEVDIRNIHAWTMAARPDIAGRYKVMDNQIGGRPHLLTARSDDVGLRMSELVDWINSMSFHGPLPAAVVHAWMTDIHPFDDGNGRVARLLTNFILFRDNWPCLIIRAGPDRLRYYEALRHSDEGGDIGPLLSLFVEGIDRTLTEMQDPEFSRRLLTDDLRRRNDFEAWSGMTRGFENQLKDALRQQGLTMEHMGAPSEEQFAWHQRYEAAGNMWWVKVHNADRSIDLLLWLGYQSSDLRDSLPGLTPAPSVFVSERNESPEWLHPYRPLWNDARATVHEVSLQPKATSENRRVVLRSSTGVERTSISTAVNLLSRSLADIRRDV